MKKFKSLLAATLVALLSAALILPLAACVDENSERNIYVTSAGGMALKDVTVELFQGSTSFGSKKTDEKGAVSYTLQSNEEYTVTVADLPAGFLPEAYYAVKGSDANTYIRIDSKVIEDGKPTRLYTTGDVLYDFEENYYTYGANGLETRKAKLSEFFNAGKKAVLINFFYNTCVPCQNEEPALIGAYKKYADKLEIIAINEMPDTREGESPADLRSKVQTNQVPYLMCKDDAKVGTWFSEFVQGRYPTSIMIDRYGILCETVQGSVDSQKSWEGLFDKYTSDKYSHDITPGKPPEMPDPDKPNDFGVSMPSSPELNTKINNTGKRITFSADKNNSSYGWPWDLNDDETAIYPTNTKHLGTMAVIYAQIELDAGEVFAFDYKMSTIEDSDYFYVSLDSRMGTGRQILMESGEKDWQTGYAYAALEKGTHEIEFSFYMSTSIPLDSVDNKVYINNIRIVSVDDMNTAIAEKEETFELPYFATRNYDEESAQFEAIDSVYLAEDGYYHVGTGDPASENDPYLLLDFTHSTPFFFDNSKNLFNYFNSKVSTFGGFYINNVNYEDKFNSYISYSTNSTYTGLVPVTAEVRSILTAVFNDEIPVDDDYYTPHGWLQFCVYYKQFGKQQTLKDPIEGLAYFSAYEAYETTGRDTYVLVDDGTGQFWMDPKSSEKQPDGTIDGTDGHYVDVEGTKMSSKGNYNLNENINEVHFDRVLMPRGLMFKFKPTTSGVYSINGVDCYYYKDDEAIIDDEETDALLFSGDLNISHAYANPIATSDSGRYDRNEVPNNSFKLVHYLEAGETYYICVRFHVAETIGDFTFRIDKLDDNYSYISQAASNAYYVKDGAWTLNTYCNPAFDDDTRTYNYGGEIGEQKVWYDKNTGDMIYLDFTELSVMFDYFTIETVLSDKKTGQLTFDISKKEWTDEYGVTYDISLDLEARYGKEENWPKVLKDILDKYEITDYTNVMKTYLELATSGNKDAELYGLLPVNDELYSIIQLYNAKFLGYDAPEEWLKACCVRVYVGPNNSN